MEEKLPKGWKWTDLKEIGSFVRGVSYKKELASQTPKENSCLILRGGNIQDGKIKVEKDLVFVDDNLINENQKIKKGDVIIVASTGSSKIIGKAATILEDDKTISFGAFLMLVRPIHLVEGKYFGYFFQSSNYRDRIRSLAAGININNIKRKYIEEMPFPLPSLPEQKRIVAKLDTLFASLDNTKARLEKIPQLLKNFRQAVLTQAVTGKLTEEWREGKELGDLDVLFESLNKRRQNHSKKKIRSINNNLRVDVDLFKIPDLWRWSTLHFLMNEDETFRYGVVQPGKDIDGQQKLIRVLDLKNGKVLKNQLRGISYEVDSKYKSACVKTGDLLVSIVGTIGRTAIVTNEENGFNIARAIARVPIRDVNPKYIKYYIDSEFGQNLLSGDAREVARKTLNLEQLKTLPIPVPPLEEQHEIVRRVESLFAKADAIEQQYQKLKEKVDALPQAILAKAFRGELVEQNPLDEPASVLLDRIRAEKEKMAAKGKKKTMKRKVDVAAEPDDKYRKKER